MSWLVRVLFMATGITFVACQVPGLGYCPELTPMVNFDLEQFKGMWYEAERMFAVVEAGSKCVSSNYSVDPDGKLRVYNQVTSRLTGIKRVLDGEIKMVGKTGEAKMSVKYTALPVPIDTEYSILDTDYKTYAVAWSCGSLGPFNTQSAWILARTRIPSKDTMQRAYGILDKNKIRRTFFVSSDQENCDYTAPPTDAPTTPPPTTAAVDPGAREARLADEVYPAKREEFYRPQPAEDGIYQRPLSLEELKPSKEDKPHKKV